MRRILGKGDLWITEFILAYDGQPSYSVSIMEFVDGKVARETQYFGDPFEPDLHAPIWSSGLDEIDTTIAARACWTGQRCPSIPPSSAFPHRENAGAGYA